MGRIGQKVRYVYRHTGLIGVLGAVTRAAASACLRFVTLPASKIGVYNGVPVRCVPLFQRRDVQPDYEKGLIAGVRAHVGPGDHAVVVGGGIGATTVVAARVVGDRGRVACYEAADERLPTIRETVRLNGVQDRVEVIHAIVAHAFDLAGAVSSAPTLAPRELPNCDVLVLDCEGAEVPILEGLGGRPRRVVVECHAKLGAPVERVADILERSGYAIASRTAKETDPSVVVLCAVAKSP